MVGIHLKHGGETNETGKEFLYECQCTAKIDEIATALTEIANLQLQIQCVGLQLQLQPRLLSLLNFHPNVSALIRALSEAISYASKDQVLHNKALSKYVLKDHMQNIEREFVSTSDIMGYPNSNLQQLLADLELYQEDKVQLWWANKELVRGKRLCDYFGKNEKTRVYTSVLTHVSIFGGELTLPYLCRLY